MKAREVEAMKTLAGGQRDRDSIHWAHTFVREAGDMTLLHVMCIKYSALDQMERSSEV